MSVVQSGTINTSTITLGSNHLNTTIKLDIRISNSPAIWGWSILNVQWNASMMQLTKVQEGPFLTNNTSGGSSTPTMVGTARSLFDNLNGLIKGGLAESLNTDDTSFGTSGVLATLSFNVTDFGSSNVVIKDGNMRSSSSDKTGINASCISASIIVTNSTSPTLPPTDNSDFHNFTLQIFTNKGPLGAGNGGTYGPQDLMELYALVGYQNTPLHNQDVTFSVKSPNGSAFSVREGKTNNSGIAKVEYRLPSPDKMPLVVFGTCTITASINAAQNIVTNSTNFTYNYLCNLENVSIPASVRVSNTLPIQLDVNTGLFATAASELAITVYDQANIPIGSFSYINSRKIENFTVINAMIPVPSWAFVGQGKVSINLLSADGVALAPETIVIFKINS
jgi:hypothetical protein